MLRHITADDAATLAAYRGKPVTNRGRCTPSTAQLRSSPTYATCDSPKPGAWLQIGTETGGWLIGDLAVCVDAADSRQVRLGCTLAAAAQGHGYVAEALRAVISLLFTEHGVHRICARCDTRNDRSGAVLERIGMRREVHHQVSLVDRRMD